jgi:class 3 adenylate cyclase
VRFRGAFRDGLGYTAPGGQERPVKGKGVDIEGWLRGLGLERYAGSFRDNEIDAAVLSRLTDEHLKELGLPLGPRLKLLAAIATLHDATTPSAPAPGMPMPAGAAPSRAAERRQLTVMFCDLVGSTALSSQLDPEEMQEVLRVYQNAVAGEIARYGGHLAKFLGDGVLAYFGWPRAHEDEAERAVRAGQAIAEAVARLATPAGGPLAARVGIATGLVVVGDLLGEGAAREEAVVGATPNLAARLQGEAAPGTVVIADDTRRLLGEMFDLRELAPAQLKGFADPVNGFQVVGEHLAGSRFEAHQVRGAKPRARRSGSVSWRSTDPAFPRVSYGRPVSDAEVCPDFCPSYPIKPAGRCPWSGATKSWRWCLNIGGRQQLARVRQCCW